MAEGERTLLRERGGAGASKSKERRAVGPGSPVL